MIDNSRVTIQIVVSFTDNSRCVIYDHNMFIVLSIGQPSLTHAGDLGAFWKIPLWHFNIIFPFFYLPEPAVTTALELLTLE